MKGRKTAPCRVLWASTQVCLDTGRQCSCGRTLSKRRAALISLNLSAVPQTGCDPSMWDGHTSLCLSLPSSLLPLAQCPWTRILAVPHLLSLFGLPQEQSLMSGLEHCWFLKGCREHGDAHSDPPSKKDWLPHCQSFQGPLQLQRASLGCPRSRLPFLGMLASSCAPASEPE